MKDSSWLLILSLLGNACVGAWLWSHPSPSTKELPKTAVESVALSAPPADAIPAAIDRGTWARLKSGSDAEFAQKLREENFPPEVIRALLRERIRLRFADRLNALKSDAKDEYWRRKPSYSPGSNLSPQARTARRAIDREIDDAVKAAMGPDIDSASPEERLQRERKYGNLPREKADQLAAIDRDYDEMSQAIRDSAGPIRLRADREQLQLLQKEKRADLEAILTPEELLEYDLRASPSASAVRNRLTFFHATEDEYRALTQVQLAFDREYGAGELSQAEESKRNQAEAALQEKMQAALTPERAQEYKLLTSREYKDTVQLLRSFNYETDLARDIVTVQHSISDRAAAIRQQAGSSDEMRRAQLESLYREANATLNGQLTPAALEQYKIRAGRWLQQLQQKPKTPQRSLPRS